MYLMLSDDGKKSSTAKGVNIATEFNELRETLFNNKIMKQKMKRIQSKNQKLVIYESAKYHYLFLMIKDLF